MSVKNVNELREDVAKQMEKVSIGKMSPASANAYSNLAGRLYSSVKLEMEYHRMHGTKPDIPFMSKTKK